MPPLHGVHASPPGSIKRSDRMCLLAGNKHGARYRQMAGPLPTTVPAARQLHDTAAPSILYEMRARYENLRHTDCSLFLLRADVRNTRYCDYARVFEITTDESRPPFRLRKKPMTCCTYNYCSYIDLQKNKLFANILLYLISQLIF